MKPNTSLNSVYELFSRMAQASSLPPRDYLAARARLRQFLARKSHPSVGDMYFNVVDTILAAIAVPAYQTYYERNFALEDRRRLIAIKRLLRDEGTAPEGMADFLTGLDAKVYGSIATGKLPLYGAGMLRFDYSQVNPDWDTSVSL